MDSASFIVSRANNHFRVTEEITIYQGVRFAKVTFVFQSEGAIDFDWIQIPFTSRGQLIEYANSVGIIDNTLHMVNQIVFPNNQLGNDVMLRENPENYELIFNLQGSSTAQVYFYVGLCPFVTQSTNGDYNSLIENNAVTYLDVVSDDKLVCFDYKKALAQWKIAYIAVTNEDVIARFSNDPTFEASFQNSEAAVFRVAP